MDPVTLIAFGSVVLKFLLDFAAIMLIAWLALEVCKEVCSYLREKRREVGVLYKRRAIEDLINAAKDEEVKQDLRCIREKHMGLFIPLDANDNAVEADVCSVKARDFARDDMADKMVIADDESMSPLT